MAIRLYKITVLAGGWASRLCLLHMHRQMAEFSHQLDFSCKVNQGLFTYAIHANGIAGWSFSRLNPCFMSLPNKSWAEECWAAKDHDTTLWKVVLWGFVASSQMFSLVPTWLSTSLAKAGSTQYFDIFSPQAGSGDDFGWPFTSFTL